MNQSEKRWVTSEITRIVDTKIEKSGWLVFFVFIWNTLLTLFFVGILFIE